ncbi:MAG: transglutaminase TgpA family protein, partial [Candidatus Methylomirabilaceae bacterium]
RAFLLAKAAAGPFVAGFSDKVELGSFGTIQTDPGVVMRVRLTHIGSEEIPQLPLRWRGVAFDRFDGGAWMVSAAGREEIGRSPGGLATIGRPSGRGRMVRQEIALEPIGTDVLFAAPRLIQLLGPFPRVFADAVGTITQPSPPVGRVRYLAVSELEPADSSGLSDPTGSYPAEIRDLYLQLPRLAPRVRALAEALAKGVRDPREIARRVEAHLRDGYGYSLDLRRDSRYDPIEDFLFVQRAGNCEYFAASMAVLLRAAKVPARVVNGFQRGEWNEFGGYLAVRQRDAHSWVEVYVPGAGWVTFDPSPRVGAEAAAAGLLGRVARYLDALGMQWDRYVVAYSLSDQLRLVSVARRRADLVRERTIELLGGLRRAMAGALRLLIDGSPGARLRLLLPAAAIIGVVMALRQRGVGGSRLLLGGDRRDLQFYRRLLALLARRGFRKEPGVTPLEFAAGVEAHGHPDLAGVSRVVDLYYRVRYARRPLEEPERRHIDDVIRRLAKAR